GKYTIYLNNSVVSSFFGYNDVKKAFEEETGIKFGQVTSDGLIGLFETACIGMSDQEPAALINEEVFPSLTPQRVKEIIKMIKQKKSIDEIKGNKYGDGNNAHVHMHSLVYNNIREKGSVLFTEYTSGDAIKKMVKNFKPENVIEELKKSGLKGRGGAGFPTGLKWETTRKMQDSTKYIFCNADEGEPGTFKDRVILTELPYLLFEGMVIAGYTVGAKQGILYLRNEYRYMRNFLEHVLDEMRKNNMLGKSIAGMDGFNFDIRIQCGAGAYVCGEESALIESAEGKRGEPRDRPPFPAESGYSGKPTVLNNVETYCNVVKIIFNSSDWFNKFGTKDSKGTKVLSISGDCEKPGIYELEFGTSIRSIIEKAGAKIQDTQAVQVGGPSGTCISEKEFDRKLGYEDMATGGSFIIIGKKRDLIKDVVLNFQNFFMEESCGSCVPCRVLTGIYKRTIEKIINGKGTKKDVENLLTWSSFMKNNRCGLGQTAMNPTVTTIKNFRELYDKKVKDNGDFVT
ncbi:MAG TPA: NADH-ubiquinone oxidoreductase-F iron-sulfur binding region domain-containing protein, partial [Candidatus Goldiibacteriota bacterium]|nr:NADH-ubiquinone oxidoreductase-F iron-sulfur binding region domain-containing protein [Candidatus Goldiibacteriota bacterium]